MPIPGIQVVSFDLEGTLATPSFSNVIWRQAIPALYARSRNVDLAQAKDEVFRAYDEVGDHNLEWYDIKYWFVRFGLDGYETLLAENRSHREYYPEVGEVLGALRTKYALIIISNSPREFLDILAQDIAGYFKATFSTLSEFGSMKSPAVYRRICGVLGVAPANVVHVGDSYDYDVACCEEAGVKAFHLVRDTESRPARSIGDLRQLAACLS